MSAAVDVDTVASLVWATVSLDPAVLLFRRVPSFEVEFAALEMEDDLDLTAWDEAVLGLANARGAVTPRDADAYLGLGDELSQAIVGNLARERLLAEAPAPAPEPSWGDWQQSPHVNLFTGLARAAGLGRLASSDPRAPSQARVLKESAAPDAPLHVLTEAGRSALQRGRRVVRFRTRARLVFWESPLRFVDVESERHHRFGHIRRDEPLKPEAVPPVFRTIDDALGLPPAERARQIGIETGIPGLRGRLVGVSRDSTPTLVGVEPGKTWEVRRLPEQRDGLLVVAGFAVSSPERLMLRTFVGSTRDLRDDVHLAASTLLDVAASAPNALTAALRARGLPALDMAPDGAFRVRAPADEIGTLLGRGEAPSPAYVPLEKHVPGWSAAVRVRALPADRAAAERAFFLLLGRRRAALRASLERACLDTAAALRAYWQEPFEPPPLEAVLAEMWRSRELRSVLCARRLEADLVTPYAPEGEVR